MAGTDSSPYRQVAGNRVTILFIHGFMGNASPDLGALPHTPECRDTD